MRVLMVSFLPRYSPPEFSVGQFALHGHHCWFDESPQAPGSAVVDEFRPADGVVKAQLNSLVLRSCTGVATCTVSGSVEATGAGVFE